MGRLAGPMVAVAALCLACSQSGPRVLSTYPVDGSRGVPLDARVEIAFDRPVRIATDHSPIVLTLEGERVEGFASVGEGGGPVVFEPRFFLLAGRTYRVTLGEGIEDLAGNRQAEQAAFSFETVEGCDIEPSARALLPAGPDGTGGWIVPGGRRISPLGTQLQLGSQPLNLALSPDGRTLVSTNNGWGENIGAERKVQSLYVVDTTVPEVSQQVLRPRPEALFFGLAFSGDGSRLFASGGGSNRVEEFQVLPDGTLEKVRDLEADGFPAGLALDEARGVVYVAAQLGSDVLAVDLVTGERRWKWPVGTLPYDVQLGPGGEKLYVSLWGRAALFEPGRVAVLDAESGQTLGRIDVGKNPEDLLLAPDGRLFVACSDADRVDVIDTDTDTLATSFELRQTPGDPVGLSPIALALDEPRDRLYVACAQENSIHVLSLKDGRRLGRIPTAWYPSAVVLSHDGGTLYVANARGTGTGPNPARVDIESLLRGTLSIFPVPEDEALPELDATVRNNLHNALRFFPDRCLGKAFPLPRAVGEPSPIKHVIFVLRENKTYDQNLGDLEGTDGDPSLVMFGETVTPNLHALAREFCNLDNFHAEVEVSVTGHYWCVAGMLNDFAEKAWGANYRDNSRLPALGALQVDYPPGLFIWHKLRDAGIDFRNYGEPYGLVSEYNEFADHVNMDYMLDLGQNLYSTPDQNRVAWFMEEVDAGVFPPFVYLSLLNDHTYGTSPGQPTPQWMVAENDYATGLLVDRISHSPYWSETLIIITEDDPQSGADHVDNHRSIALLVSPYTRRGYTSSVHYGFSSLIRTYGLILGMPAMNLLDGAAAPVYDCFTSTPDFTPFTVREQLVPYEENPQSAPGGLESELMDFSMPDRAAGLGRVLWMATRPGEPVPADLLEEAEEGFDDEVRWPLPVPAWRGEEAEDGP